MGTQHRGRRSPTRDRRTLTLLAAALAGVVIAGGAVVLDLTSTGGGSGPAVAAPVSGRALPPGQRSRFDNGLGYTDVVTVATPDPRSAHPLRSLAPAPLIAGSGRCLQAMDGVREVMASVPAGGLLARAPGWARLVGPRMGLVSDSCPEPTAAAFRDQELTPWLNAALPTGVVDLPVAPPA